MTMAHGIQMTEVDGVPTVFAPSAGPMMAGLVFRVGQADETLARRGVTHLVEHLALHRAGLTDYHYNGVTCDNTTTFHMRGSELDVVAFLDHVCTGLRDLPLERMETEKTLLRTERAGKDRPVNAGIPMWRYGARGYGLVGFPEFGLPALGPDDLVNWVRTWFTRENAVLWVSGESMPTGLRLPLPSGGRRRPLPAATSALPVTPAYFVASANGIVLDTLVPRGARAMVFARVLDRELFRALRQEGGYSYQASAAYDSRDDVMASVTAIADALPHQKGAVLGGLIDVMMKLKVGRIEQEDIDAALVQATEAMTHPEVEAARLPGHAFGMLIGEPIVPAEQHLAELRSVTTVDVHAMAQVAMESALLMVPEGHRADWAGFTAAPTSSDHVIAGDQYQARGESSAYLVIGKSGVSVVADERPATVRFEECAAALAFPDGARQLVGYDGICVQIEPSLFTVNPAAVTAIDAAIDPSVLVRMPARAEENIPRPPDHSGAEPSHQGQHDQQQWGQQGQQGQPFPAYQPYQPYQPYQQQYGPAAPKTIGTWGYVGRIAVVVMTVLICAMSSLCTGLAIFDDDPDPEMRQAGWVIAGTTWVCLLAFLVPAVFVVIQLYRDMRRRG